ncbi:hypothetical protein LWI29_017149 [Acer saccharum]|uniref:Uncharacterized protein n=1 Tax=Acer saccharum TaxID=4024 RepID=A0AA39VZ71_ACESA|nr:hypothetical protein LWI29_017149 [Acer saccharum]
MPTLWCDKATKTVALTNQNNVEDKEQRTVAKDGVDERCGGFGDNSSDGERGGDLLCFFLSLQRRQERFKATMSGSDINKGARRRQQRCKATTISSLPFSLYSNDKRDVRRR